MVTLVNVPRYIALLKNYGSKPTLTQWLKKEGDLVVEGQALAVIETSKASLEIVAATAGIIFFLRKAGENVKIGDTLGIIAGSKSEVAEFKTMLTNYQLN